MLILMLSFWQIFPRNQAYFWLYTVSLVLAGAFSLLLAEALVVTTLIS